jgi:hypothetical protein
MSRAFGTPWAEGAALEIDQFADQGEGVFVGWKTSDKLAALFEAPLLARDFGHPAVRLH